MSESKETISTISQVRDIQKVLRHAGIDMHDPNFTGTPHRWLKYLEHYTQTYDPAKDLGVTFPPRGSEVFDNAMIVQVGIPYRAICAHHLIPVLGTAHVGYIPDENIVGLSKLSRLVYGASHETPSLQEDVCAYITEALMGYLHPLGAMCVINAEHSCMAARGIEEASGCIQTVTSSIEGVFIERAEVRAEFYSLIGVTK